MPSLIEIQRFIDTTLRTPEIPDYPGALNGLQLQNQSREVVRIIAAVDACRPVIEAAAALPGPGLLLVHHGMFWSGAQKITGSIHARLRAAILADLAISSAHIPLDVHPEFGNNAQLVKALGCSGAEPWFDWKGIKLGQRVSVEMPRAELAARLERAVGGPVHVCPGGPEVVRSLGVITGGAGSEIAAISASGVDTFITGEGPHWSYTAAEELGVNLLYGGHYATETFGVKALAAKLAEVFGIPWEFIDHPSGL